MTNRIQLLNLLKKVLKKIKRFPDLKMFIDSKVQFIYRKSTKKKSKI